MSSQFKQDNPGCDCCGCVCRDNWLAEIGDITQIQIEGTGATLLNTPRIGVLTPVTGAACTAGAFATECVEYVSFPGNWPTIRITGPTSCTSGDPADHGIFRVPTFNSFNVSSGYICETGGTPVTTGSDQHSGANFNISVETFCDGATKYWRSVAFMSYSVQYRTPGSGCDITTPVPDQASMEALGYVVTQTGGFGNPIRYERTVTGAGGFIESSYFALNTNYAGTITWICGISQEYTKTSAADLVGLSASMAPTYNPGELGADWEIT